MKKINIVFLLSVILALPIANSQQQVRGDTGITPDSFMWGLDKALDQLGLLLTFDKGEKAKKGIEIARERLLEVREMVEANKLEMAEKAKEEHGKALANVKQRVKEVEKDNATEEIEEIIEIEKELEWHENDVEDIDTELKFKMEINGEATEEQKALISLFLISLKEQAGKAKIEIKSKKDKIKTRIKAETGKSEKEIEDDLVGIEEKKGLTGIKTEKAAEEIEGAKEDLGELEEELQENKAEGHIADEKPITELIGNAKKRISNAEDAFKSNDFGEAFGQANAAHQLIGNAERILEKVVEKFEEEEEDEEEREIEVETEDGKSKIKVEIGDEKLKFTMETTDKNAIIQEIAAKTGLSIDEVTKLAKFEEEKQGKAEGKKVKTETEEEAEIKEEI